MDSKIKVKVGDSVMYNSGEIVVDEEGIPLIVIDIKKYYVPIEDAICVFYNNGAFDFLDQVTPTPPLLLELL